MSTRHGLISLLLLVVACDRGSRPVPQPATSSHAQPAVVRDDRDDRIATFWNWFTENAAALRTEDDLQHVMERVSAEVERVNPGVFAEIGRAGDNRELVLTADGNKDLFPIVQELYARRPRVAGWNVVAFRQRGDLSLSIEFGGRSVALRSLKFVAVTDGSKLDVEVFIPGFTTMEEMGQMGFVILDHVVGEYDMETKVRAVELSAIDKAPPAARPIAELPALLDTIK